DVRRQEKRSCTKAGLETSSSTVKQMTCCQKLNSGVTHWVAPCRKIRMRQASSSSLKHSRVTYRLPFNESIMNHEFTWISKPTQSRQKSGAWRGWEQPSYRAMTVG